MGWSKDNGRYAKVQGDYAKEQADRAEVQADYIEEKKPLIDTFTGEQTNLQTQLNDLTHGLTVDSEVIQARDGFPVLNERLKSFNQQLAEKVTKGDITKEDFDITTDANKLTLNNVNDEFRQAITGNAPVFTGLEPNSVVEEYLAPGLMDKINSGKGRTATYIIAPFDAPDFVKKGADYVCSGTNDETTINTVIDFIKNQIGTVDIKTSEGYLPGTEKNQGGKVVLLNGVFNISNPINLTGTSNIQLEGMGASTVINNLSTTGTHAIQAINPDGTTKNRIIIKSLLVKGNPSSGDGINLTNVDYQIIDSVFAQENGGSGIRFKGVDTVGSLSGLENKIISNCICNWNELDGIFIESVHETMITSCHMEENKRYNMHGKNATNLHLANCSIEDVYGTHDLYIEAGRQTQLSNVVIEGNVYINVWSGYKPFLENVEISGELTFTSNNNGGSLAISNSTIAKGFNFQGSAVFASNNFMVLKNITSTAFTLNGGRCRLGITGDTTVYEMTINNSLSFSGVELEVMEPYNLKAGADNARLSIGGASNIYFYDPLIVLGNGKASVRFSLTGCNTRLTRIDFTDIALIIVSGNLLAGTGSINVLGAGIGTKFSDNLYFSTMKTTIDATRTGFIASQNNMYRHNSSFVDNTGTAIKNGEVV